MMLCDEDQISVTHLGGSQASHGKYIFPLQNLQTSQEPKKEIHERDFDQSNTFLAAFEFANEWNRK